jgi:GLPGLI family protein
MKPKLFLVLIFITTAFDLLAQQPSVALARVFYTLKHCRDTSLKDSIYKENMVLYIGEKSSLYASYDREIQIETIQKDLDKQSQAWTGPGLPMFKTMSGTRKTNNQALYIFQNDKKIFTKEYLMKNYLYEEPLDEINWQLVNETKNFEKIKAQKATATFKGREWVAWFAPEIPFETGPWKLHGLPGLIVEAYDKNKEVQFLFTGFETIKQSETINTISIELPKNTLKVSLADINKLKETMHKNPREFFMAQIQLNEGKLDAKEMEGLSFKKINNPIEQPEKK